MPTLRLATAADTAEIAKLMRASVEDLFPRFYSGPQSASAAVHLTDPDTVLIEDETYFVFTEADEIVACGGWSKRDKLYTGSGDQPGDARMLDPAEEPARVRAMFVRSDWTRRGLGKSLLDACVKAATASGFSALTLMATLPGVPLYRAFGFQETAKTIVPLPDGVFLEGVEMHYPLT